MAIVSHKHRFIFLKTRKTAGSSVEIWLAPFLDPEKDLAAVTADLAHYRPDLAARLQSRNLPAHASASEVRTLVGETVWKSYFKFSIERNPWDRMISLWQWRRHHRRVSPSFDEFLSAIVDGTPSRLKQAGAQGAMNWPIYAIEDAVVADEMIIYDRLEQGLSLAMARIGLHFDGVLPHAKAGIRDPLASVDTLTERQSDIIAALFEREIREFGFQRPDKGYTADERRGT